MYIYIEEGSLPPDFACLRRASDTDGFNSWQWGRACVRSLGITGQVLDVMRPSCVRQHRYFRLSLASPLGLSLGQVALSAVP